MKDLTNLQTFSDEELFQMLAEIKENRMTESSLVWKRYDAKYHQMKDGSAMLPSLHHYALTLGLEIAIELETRLKALNKVAQLYSTKI